MDYATGRADVGTVWHHLLPMASLAWRPEGKNRQLYLTYSEGYRAGGYNTRNVSPSPEPFRPENTRSLELGGNGAAGGELLWNAALFFSRIDDLRVITFNDDLSNNVETAQKATAYGLEAEIDWLPTENLELFGSLGVTRGTYDEYENGGIDYSGNTIIDVPDLTLSAGGRYDAPGGWFFRGSAAYTGGRYYDNANGHKEGGYALVNAALGLDRGEWNFTVYADNLLDRGYTDFVIVAPTLTAYRFGAPRTAGVRVSKSF